ncbi:MAG: hypothetical protein SFY67_12010 [Candidatus Melainabacteria bacterium]|nr:hypothetical protein [Candidatus Melainabacteria bacterium]
MSEHNFLSDIFTAIFLPLFLIIILGLMTGVKTDVILTSYFRLILSIAGSCIEITAKLTGAFILETLKAISQQSTFKANRQFAERKNQKAEPQVTPVKVIVVED